MRKSSDKIVRPLTVKYAVALALLAVLAAGNYWILQLSIEENARLADIVNQAGRQRVLLHTTAMHAERLIFSFNENARLETRHKLLRDTFELEEAHYELMPSSGESPTRLTEDLRSVYEDTPWLLDSEMRNYLVHVRALANGEPNELKYGNAHFTYIRSPETVDRLREGLDAVVKAYERRSEAKTRQLRLFAIWSFASTLLLLLINGWFVFRPMVKKVRTDVAALDELNETLEDRVARRTAEAMDRADRLAESEAALLESQALYFSLVQHMPMSVLRKDTAGSFTFANERFCELVGKSAEEIVGKTDADLYSPALAEKYRADDLRIMNDGALAQVTEEHQTPNGQRMFVEVLKVPLRSAQGTIVGTQTMFWDVTDRKVAETRALQAERLAAIGQMMTGVAHESRNALQQIQACSQMLRWELEEDLPKRELLDDLQQAEGRLLRLFEELRDYAAPLRVDRKPCDIRELVGQAWSSTVCQREGRNAEFREHAPDGRLVCCVDPMRVEQIFRNLFENAIAACTSDIVVQVTYRWEPDERLYIGVRDNGIGLSKEQKQRMFEPFFTTKTRGTGLGLAIVKRIVEAHDGQIEIESVDSGTRIAVRIPQGPIHHDFAPSEAWEQAREP